MNLQGDILENLVAMESAGTQYPGGWYNPSEKYPEYLWGDTEIAEDDNLVYDAIRKCLYGLGLDRENFGKAVWNPLGEIINKGDTVLLKPNLVVSDHPNLECIVTNPAIVRAVLDFVCIALQGTGRIIVGDAPMQRCNFGELIDKTGYNRVIDFFRKRNIEIEFIDFRNFVSDYSSESVKILRNCHADSNNFVAVDLKKESLHCSRDRFYKRYRVTNYDYRRMREYHNPQHHIYLIRKEILEADVVINLPKPKTHRKAGFTGALKNVVGTVVHKECLPHHIRGSVETGGDEYLKKDFFKCWRTFCYEQIDLANIYDKKTFLFILKKMLSFTDKAVGKFKRDPFSEGSWYGNDTIWRTFVDINRCLMYSDKKGALQEKKQRKFLTIADMIIAGEKDGPVHASPKNVGLLMVGTNPVAVDFLIAQVMGFDYKKIPALSGIMSSMTKPLWYGDRKDVKVVSSSFGGEEKQLDEVSCCFEFVPTNGWKGNIEMENYR